MAESNMNSILRLFPAALILLAVAGCNSSSGGGDDIVSGGGGSSPGTGDELNLVIEGPNTVAPTTQNSFTARLTDGSGNGIEGEFIDVDANVGDIPEAPGGTTNEDGVFAFTYVAPTQTGTDQITAALTRDGSVVTQDGSPVRDIQIVTLSPGEFSFNRPTAPREDADPKVVYEPPPYDDESGVELGFVWSEDGEPVDGKNLNLSLGNSGLGGGFLIGGSSTPVTNPTLLMQNGDFPEDVRLVAGANGGIQTIIATEAGTTRQTTIDIQYVGQPDDIAEFEAEDPEIVRNSATFLNVTVVDADGTPVPDVEVSFSIIGCAGTANGEPCQNSERVSPETGITDFDGETRTIYFSSRENLGPAEIRATVNASVQESTFVTVQTSN